MSYQLSEGSLAVILAGGNVEDPVMQILGHKKIAGTSASSDRFRLLVSDGKHLNSFAMLATQLNDKVTSGELCDFTVIQITRYITSMVSNADRGDKRVMVILGVKVLAMGTEVGFKIGDPKPLSESGEADKNAVKQQQTIRPIQHKLNQPMNNVNNASSVLASPGGSVHTHPISSLSPYQNKWVIKARVTSKSPVRTWANARGEGKLFSMDLVDESGEIRATAFKEQCDKFYDIIEVNSVYLISRCILKTANKKFTNIKNDYEMTFTNDTQVIPCNEDTSDIPTLTFDFTPINKLSEMDTNSIVDVIGVCKSSSDVQTLISRNTNRELRKRDITVVDQTNTGVVLSLWGSQAEEFDGSLQPVIAVKNGRINEFGGGRSVSLMQSSVLQINPDITEAHKLRGWFDNVGSTQEQESISTRTGGVGGGTSNWMTLKEAQENQLGCGDKPDYFSCTGTLLIVRSENSLYKACPTPECNKKVIDQNNGMYRCEKCNREYPNFKFRLLLSVSLGDFTGNQWITCFQDVAETLLGISAQELGDLLNDAREFQQVFVNAVFKTYVFRLRAKMENYNDENRLKVTAVEAKPLNLKEHNRRLITEIKEMAGVGSSA
ncbi:replication protein A 70 kDa DNA-binding subunit isoform X2 [Periplaneta americana]|uniref:replication protein A 70 kDa DNA-binding subunit isoform X2 n=1 Tax=Periplaneta americana TaxID=6978 RepID=UPI0037E79C84